MRTVSLVILFRLALLVAIAASTVLVIEYRDPAFCGFGSGCYQVRTSDLAESIRQSLGVTLPQVGLAAYVGLLGASIMARSQLHQWMLSGMSGVGAVAAAYFLYVQKVEIEAFCAWCVAVDTSALVAGGAGVAIALRASGRATPRAERDEVWTVLSGGSRVAVGWAIAGALAIALPFVWSAYPVVPPAPPAIQALQVPGKVTYLEFTDFECPYCRQLHVVIEDLRKQYGERLAFIRKMKPLSMHPGALPAALGYLCVPEDKMEAMAAALYEAPPEQLTPGGVAAIGVRLGADPGAFAACLESPETKKRLDDDSALFQKLGPQGLPLSYIGPRVVVGFDEPKIRRAVAIEASGGRVGLPVSAMFVVLAAVFAGAGWFTWTRGAAASLADKPRAGKD